MKITYHKHTIRREKAREEWIKIATDYLGGMTASEIAIRYGKTPAHIYWVLRKLRTEEVN